MSGYLFAGATMVEVLGYVRGEAEEAVGDTKENAGNSACHDDRLHGMPGEAGMTGIFLFVSRSF